MAKKIKIASLLLLLLFVVQVIKTEAIFAAPERTVTIKVIDKNSNQPIAGATVGYLTVVSTMESQTDANGIASFVLSETRAYKFFASHPDYKKMQQELIIDSTSPNNLEMTLALETLKQKNGVFVTIGLIAQDDRQPVSDAKVYLSGSVLKAIYSGVTDQAGKLKLFLTDGGKYTVDIYHSNFKTVKGNLEVNIYGDQKEYPLSYELQRQDKRHTAGEETKQLKIQVNAKVEDGSAKPLAGATIYFGNDSRKTDKDGTVTFGHNLEVGTYGKLYVEAQGYETKEESFIVGQYARTPLVHRPSRWQRWLRWATGTGTPADTVVTTTLEPAKKDALVFIVEVTDAENNQLIENATVELKLCNPVVVEGKQKEIFAIVKTSSGRARFTIPADFLVNICSVRASHPKYEERWSDVDQKLLTLSNEPRYFSISLKSKVETSSAQSPSLEWQLTKAEEDPGNLTGKAIGGYNVCEHLKKNSAIITNTRFPQTRSTILAQGDIPQTLKPNQKFNITMSVSCVTENEYCCIDAGVGTEGIKCEPADRVGGCKKQINDARTYECTVPNSPYYDKLAVATFVGGLGTMARYEYTRKDLIKHEPQTLSSPSK